MEILMIIRFALLFLMVGCWMRFRVYLHTQQFLDVNGLPYFQAACRIHFSIILGFMAGAVWTILTVGEVLWRYFA